MRRSVEVPSERPAPKYASSGEHEIDHAGALRSRLEAPIYNRLIDAYVGNGALDYEVYLNTQALLSLQTPQTELVHPDELMFQIVHQGQELWLKLLAYEGAELVRHLDNDELAKAGATLERLVRTIEAMRGDLRVLDTLTPASFLGIRRHLGDGSGQQSRGYNQLMLVAPAVLEALTRLLGRRGATLSEVYSEDEPHPELLRLCEQLVDFDEAYQQWLVAHFHLVRRTMGVDKSVRALDGLPSRVLVGRMTKPLFPDLWDVRVAMTNEWTRAGGYRPGQDRCPGVSGGGNDQEQ